MGRTAGAGPLAAVTVVIGTSGVALDKTAEPASAQAQQTHSLQPLAPEADAEETRWRQWRAKGRDDDARFRRRLRTVVIDVAAIVALGGALWFAFLT